MAGVRKNIYEELEKVKKLILGVQPQFDVRNLCVFLGRLGTHHYNKQGFLTGDEKKIYNVLIENSYNPYTVYRWSLLERIPDDIRFQLRNHYLSQKKASKMFFERRHETDTAIQISIRELGLRLIQGM
ncbi:hypothetical protein HZA96_05275 [Candidatus Woesearchaeota archaeon]|nr:hypothetical protein [Candidatus Woesearchaeota archaeon]